MIINGKAIAEEILAATRERVVALGRPVRLVAIAADTSAATASYLRIKSVQAGKAGVVMEVIGLTNQRTAIGITAAVTQAAEGADALIVQLPLPAGVDTKQVLNAIPVEKDADILSDEARARFNHGAFMHPEPLLPPVVAAMKEIFDRTGVAVAGKRAAVIGHGWLVGEPAAVWLAQQGAQVTTLMRDSERASETILNSDILVLGAGSPGIVTKDVLKAGAVVIDAGTSESGGTIVGDAAPDCADIASVFTPVPGGVGPIAVACLFRNAVMLAERKATIG